MYLPDPGIDISPFNPAIWAFGISLVCSGSGVSGAFLLLPYQLTILGYTAPGVSATNQIFNILACPAGIWRYAKEGRLIMPLAKAIAIGSLPGVVFGAWARAVIFQGITQFRIFVAFILLYLGLRLLLLKNKDGDKKSSGGFTPVQTEKSDDAICLKWKNNLYKVSTRKIFFASLITGFAGGIYGVGGGALLSPILISFFRLPVHLLAGATLFGTFATSIFGLLSYFFMAIFMDMPQMLPNLSLGLLLGLGGIPGMYCGAALQKHMSQTLLKKILAIIILVTAFFYFTQALFYFIN